MLYNYFYKPTKWIIYFLSFLEISAFSQEQSENNLFYEIAPFYNFKRGALSITFDDGVPSQFDNAVPLLNQMNIPATFYIITRDLKNNQFRNKVNEAFLTHHEIGSHTVNHPSFKNLDSVKIDFELRKSLKDINSVLGLYNSLTFAFPGGYFSDSIIQITKKYYLAARVGWGGYNSMDSLKRFELRTMSYSGPSSIGKLNNCADFASARKLWLIETFHGIDSIGYIPIKPQDFRNHLDYLKTLEGSLWFATVSSVIKYHDESKNASIMCEECNDTAYKVRINQDLNDSIYDQPLSFRVKIPNHWDSVQISGGELITTEFSNGSQYVLFNAQPNNRLVIIRPKITYLADKNPLVFVNSVSPNPFYNLIDINFRVIHHCYIGFELLDLRGNIKYTTAVEYSEGNQSLNIEIQQQLLKGIYFLKMVVSDRKHHQYLVQMLVRNL